MEIGSSEIFSICESPPEEPVYVGTADITNCFYQFRLPPSLAEFFSMPSISLSEAREIGIGADVWGSDLSDIQTLKVAPCVTAVPMGWSWAFWFVQRLHTHILQQCGFHGERILSGAWPVEKIGPTPVSLPYCDNVTMLSTSKLRPQGRGGQGPSGTILREPWY
eukprot:3908563-Amphidinium_carterae.2